MNQLMIKATAEITAKDALVKKIDRATETVRKLISARSVEDPGTNTLEQELQVEEALYPIAEERLMAVLDVTHGKTVITKQA
jgi:hypothetical protein